MHVLSTKLLLVISILYRAHLSLSLHWKKIDWATIYHWTLFILDVLTYEFRVQLISAWQLLYAQCGHIPYKDLHKTQNSVRSIVKTRWCAKCTRPDVYRWIHVVKLCNSMWWEGPSATEFVLSLQSSFERKYHLKITVNYNFKNIDSTIFHDPPLSTKGVISVKIDHFKNYNRKIWGFLFVETSKIIWYLWLFYIATLSCKSLRI